MSSFIDFAEVKQSTPMEYAIDVLELEGTYKDDKWRGDCPACDSERALVITPEKRVFYCNHVKKGGDVIALVAHIKDIGMREAAQFLMEGQEEEQKPPKKVNGTLQALDYLQYDHELVKALNMDEETARKLGVGYSPKGIMRGTVAIPVRTEDGTLVGYVGVTDAKVPKTWRV